ncbi:NTPase [Pseudomonas sp. S04]|uniref:KAP family NTPase n=1 Tax=unclassified Pseudomonas TaxID=196821 RepID=UPI00131F9551|nr:MULTISPECIES: KAP family NTPase [unclassified Pseudomonas]QHD04080.1 NTPase [Pseudomonas sp. S04]QHF36567.1 NTPase [Pseudomonas sp. S19]
MENIHFLARQDRAIENSEADALERGPFIASLVKTLVHTEHNEDGTVSSRKATGFVVGLTGEWGLGKSSVLNLLGEELNVMEHVVVATLNPWLFKGRDELVQAYFNSLREALGQSSSEKVRSLRGHFERYKASIEFVGATSASAIDILIGSGAATVFWKKWLVKGVGMLIKSKDLTAMQERKALESKLAEVNVAVVVLIDELDRVEDDEVRAVAQLVKAVGDIRGISYLVAYDPDRVAQALGRGSSSEERRKTGESYLEKIIQFPIPLRPLLEGDAKALLHNAMQYNRVELPTADRPHQTEIYEQLLRVVRTPREIKRLIGAYSVLEEIVHGEVCPYDVLAYSWLVTKAPSIRQLIADSVQRLVDDPGISEMLRQQQWRANNDAAETLNDVLGTIDENHADMLGLLFPRFGGDRAVSTAVDDDDRITKRRNLIRLLYLGNPPGMMSRADIEKVWTLQSVDETLSALGTLLNSGQLDQIVDRIGDILPTLSSSGDKIFWIAISRLLVREHDWILGEENTGSVVDDAGAILWKFAQTTPNAKVRVKAIVQSLKENGDLLIVPWILRKHLFAHGLTSHRRQNHGEVIFDLEETIALRDLELPRYYAAVISGIAIRKLPDTEAIYCMLNCSFWDDALRQSLTAQLDSMSAISTIAALLNPPNVIVDRGTLNQMFDADAVLGMTRGLLRDEGFPENEWLASSIRRFRDALLGRDPHFSNPDDDDF